MTATLEEIRGAMADQLQTIGVQSTGYVLSSASPPCAQVLRGEVEYDQAFQQGLHIWQLNVRCYVADSSDIGAAKLLDQFLDPDGDRSVKAALESDSTLGGLIQDLHVTGCNGEQVYLRDGGGPLLGSEFQVTVFL